MCFLENIKEIYTNLTENFWDDSRRFLEGVQSFPRKIRGSFDWKLAKTLHLLYGESEYMKYKKYYPLHEIEWFFTTNQLSIRLLTCKINKGKHSTSKVCLFQESSKSFKEP